MTPHPARYDVRETSGGFVVFDTFTQEPVNALDIGRPHLSLTEIMPYPSKSAAVYAAARLNRKYAEVVG